MRSRFALYKLRPTSTQRPFPNANRRCLESVDLATVSDTCDQDESFSVVHRVDDPVVAHPDPIVIAARQLYGAGGSRLPAERLDGRCDPVDNCSP